MHRRRLNFLAAVTGILAVLALAIGLQPAEATHYQAGMMRFGTAICRCPVTTGDCVCEFTY